MIGSFIFVKDLPQQLCSASFHLFLFSFTTPRGNPALEPYYRTSFHRNSVLDTLKRKCNFLQICETACKLLERDKVLALTQ